MERAAVFGRRFVLVLGMSLALSAPGDAADNWYTEDFNSWQYNDVAHTTALWDTLAGELKLHPFELTLAGGYNTSGDAYDAAVSGDYAYVADYNSGLQVIDISDPTNPTFAGNYNTAGRALEVAISGDHAYVADDFSGLKVIDISNPTNPTFVAEWSYVEWARDVTIAGDYAYVAYGDSGLQVVDITDPSNPVRTGGYVTPEFASGVAVSGDYAYVGVGTVYGLQVFDISDPSTPAFAGSCDTPGSAYDAVISGDYAYVADGLDGLTVIDISDPTNPTLAGTCDTYSARDVAVCGNYAYIADHSAGLRVIDISDPTNPTILGGYDTPDHAWGVSVSGSYAYVADGTTGLQVIDIADPVLDPALAGSAPTAPGSAIGSAISGDYAYVAAGGAGLKVFDISDPANPTSAGSCPTAGMARRVAVSGDYAYLTHEDSDLRVIDISDPTNPTIAASYDTPDDDYGIAISGDYAYVADWYSGLLVIDISDPTNPTFAGSYDTPRPAWDVAIAGDYAYVANWDSGLLVIDISDPTSPVSAGACSPPNKARGVAISGDYAYVADDDYGLVVIDITDPTNPVLAGSYDTPDKAVGVAICGDYAYVADYNSGLQVIDISDPTTPSLAGTYDMPAQAHNVTVCGDYAFVANGSYGLRVMEIFQRLFDQDNNNGQSLAINDLEEEVLMAKLTTSQIDSVYWYVSADSGSAWDQVAPDGNWHRISSPGEDLLWRSAHKYLGGGFNTACTDLNIEWLYNFALIDSVVDVPQDQGGWARVYFTRSGRDFADEGAYPITGYYLFRRIYDIGMAMTVIEQGQLVDRGLPVSLSPGQQPLNLPSLFGGSQVYSLDHRVFAVWDASAASVGQLAGIWEVVGVVPAHQQDQYICLVPTLADSTSNLVHSVYCISAETTTPSVYYFSPPDSGYSVDNLPPSAVTGLAGEYLEVCQVRLHWNPNTEYDLSHYAIYRGTTQDFVPSEINRIGTATDPCFVDDSYDPGSEFYYHYKVSAWDVHENEGPFALLTPDMMTDVPGSEPHYANALFQNIPNPFVSSTRIAFSMERAGHVRLYIFDVKGRLVRVLADEMRRPNRYVVEWDGRDGSGRPVASGAYFYLLEAPGWTAVKKMTLAH